MGAGVLRAQDLRTGAIIGGRVLVSKAGGSGFGTREVGAQSYRAFIFRVHLGIGDVREISEGSFGGPGVMGRLMGSACRSES